MRRVIDLECDLPPDEHGRPRKAATLDHPPGYGDPERLPPLPGHGFDNYRTIFTSRGQGGGLRPSQGAACRWPTLPPGWSRQVSRRG